MLEKFKLRIHDLIHGESALIIRIGEKEALCKECQEYFDWEELENHIKKNHMGF